MEKTSGRKLKKNFQYTEVNTEKKFGSKLKNLLSCKGAYGEKVWGEL